MPDNRHKFTAIFIAPFLAFGGFFAAGYFQPSADDSQAIALKIIQPCDLARQCLLTGKDNLQIKLSYSGEITVNQHLHIQAHSSVPLDKVLLAVSDRTQNNKPATLTSVDNRQHWQGAFFLAPSLDIKALILQLVINYQGIAHFAEIHLEK